MESIWTGDTRAWEAREGKINTRRMAGREVKSIAELLLTTGAFDRVGHDDANELKCQKQRQRQQLEAESSTKKRKPHSGES